jgi:hypothetical protein
MTKSPAERGHRFQPIAVEKYELNGRDYRKFRRLVANQHVELRCVDFIENG